MITLTTTPNNGTTATVFRLVRILLCGSVFGFTGYGQALGYAPPDDCQAYRVEAHVQCLYAYIELQQKRLSQIEEALHGQTDIRDRITAPAEQPRASNGETTTPVPMPLADQVYTYPTVTPGYAYAGYGYPGVPYGYPAYGAGFGLSLYPGLGLSLGFGLPGYYGRPFFAPRYIYRSPGFFRPRVFYGPLLYGGSRFYGGPRFYSGPRSFGSRSFGHHRR